jgi:hypothetical protein
MKRTSSRVIGAAALLGLVLPMAACGGGDDEQAAKSIASQIRQGDSANLEVNQKEAECIGDGFVDEIGTEKLQDYKLLDQDMNATENSDVKLSKDDADKAATVFQDCADVKSMMMQSLEDSGMPASAKDCVEKALDDKALHSLLAGTFSGDQSVVADLGPTLQKCVTSG